MTYEYFYLSVTKLFYFLRIIVGHYPLVLVYRRQSLFSSSGNKTRAFCGSVVECLTPSPKVVGLIPSTTAISTLESEQLVWQHLRS